MDLPDDLPVIERDVVRVVVQDVHGDVLLLRAQDLTDPDFGMWLELPGGCIEAGETFAQTAVRELHEETGIEIAADQVGPPTWRRTASFRYRGHRHLQHEVVVRVGIELAAPAMDVRGRLHYEAEDYPDFRWWPVNDLTASRERFYPGRLPALLPDRLASVEVDELFELFS